MVAPARNYPPRHRVGSTQLQLYIKILLFYMAVVYFCVCRYARAKSEARLDARLASELRAARALRNFTAQRSELRPLQPAQQEHIRTKN